MRALFWLTLACLLVWGYLLLDPGPAPTDEPKVLPSWLSSY